MALEKTFDELLNNLLTDMQSQFPGADISKGSLIFIKCSALASSLWGLYKYQGYVASQIFPDSSDRENLEHHAYARGVTLLPNQSDEDLQARVLDYFRRPPAGGNKYDYVKWALETPGVKRAWCLPQAFGYGTVAVVITSDPDQTGTEIPTAELIAEVQAHIDDLRPTRAKYTRVMAPEIITQDVQMLCTGGTFSLYQISQAITSYLTEFAPGQTLYPAQFISIAIVAGVLSPTLVLPAGSAVTPLPFQMIRPGVIDVS